MVLGCEQNHPEWLIEYIEYLRSLAGQSITPEQMAQYIHQALEIVEAEKYATKESRFCFRMSGATAEDVAEIRKHLTAFENSIVEISIAEV